MWNRCCRFHEIYPSWDWDLRWFFSFFFPFFFFFFLGTMLEIRRSIQNCTRESNSSDIFFERPALVFKLNVICFSHVGPGQEKNSYLFWAKKWQWARLFSYRHLGCNALWSCSQGWEYGAIRPKPKWSQSQSDSSKFGPTIFVDYIKRTQSDGSWVSAAYNFWATRTSYSSVPPTIFVCSATQWAKFPLQQWTQSCSVIAFEGWAESVSSKMHCCRVFLQICVGQWQRGISRQIHVWFLPRIQLPCTQWGYPWVKLTLHQML